MDLTSNNAKEFREPKPPFIGFDFYSEYFQLLYIWFCCQHPLSSVEGTVSDSWNQEPFTQWGEGLIGGLFGVYQTHLVHSVRFIAIHLDFQRFSRDLSFLKHLAFYPVPFCHVFLFSFFFLNLYLVHTEHSGCSNDSY